MLGLELHSIIKKIKERTMMESSHPDPASATRAVTPGNGADRKKWFYPPAVV
jgi:hypothetical protein